MGNNERAALRDRKTVFDEIVSAIDRQPLTLEELRQRLKHIAGLCWGLSIDINNEIERNETLTAENKRLLNENFGLREELRGLSAREYCRNYQSHKNKGSLETELRGENPPVSVKPKKDKPISERQRKLNEKLAAMTPQEREKYERHLEKSRISCARYRLKKKIEQ